MSFLPELREHLVHRGNDDIEVALGGCLDHRRHGDHTEAVVLVREDLDCLERGVLANDLHRGILRLEQHARGKAESGGGLVAREDLDGLVERFLRKRELLLVLSDAVLVAHGIIDAGRLEHVVVEQGGRELLLRVH